MPEMQVPLWDVLARLSLAVVAGGVLGWEREARRKPAGFRTMMMVGLGAAVFTLISQELYLAATAATGSTQVDHIRIIEGVAGGIGFLGAGTIIRSGGSVEGITTAATIWVVGAIGVACGVGSYRLAAFSLLFAVIILVVMGALEQRLSPKVNGPDSGRH